MATNQAAWIDGVGKQLRVGEAPVPSPGPNDIVVRNHAVAVNPVDWKIQDHGLYIQKWPLVLGTDVAGEVYEVGSNVTRFKKGERVIGHASSLLTQDGGDGGFQLYTRINAIRAAHLPASISYAAGSVIPLALDTGAVGLFVDHPASDPNVFGVASPSLGLTFPSLNSSATGAAAADHKKPVLVVWGGSSSVGALTIQLAAAAGAHVIATSSPHNFSLLKQCGASETFDYRAPDVVASVTAAVRAVQGGHFVGVYDAISLADSYASTVKIVAELGGGVLSVVLSPPSEKDLPASVKPGQILGLDDKTRPLWEEWVTGALEKGLLKPLPEPLVVGKGLEKVQEGLDLNRKGVSGRKVVIEL